MNDTVRKIMFEKFQRSTSVKITKFGMNSNILDLQSVIHQPTSEMSSFTQNNIDVEQQD